MILFEPISFRYVYTSPYDAYQGLSSPVKLPLTLAIVENSFGAVRTVHPSVDFISEAFVSSSFIISLSSAFVSSCSSGFVSSASSDFSAFVSSGSSIFASFAPSGSPAFTPSGSSVICSSGLASSVCSSVPAATPPV